MLTTALCTEMLMDSITGLNNNLEQPANIYCIPENDICKGFAREKVVQLPLNMTLVLFFLSVWSFYPGNAVIIHFHCGSCVLFFPQSDSHIYYSFLTLNNLLQLVLPCF